MQRRAFIATIALLALTISRVPGQTTYSAVDIGALSTGGSTLGTWLNNAGLVVGQSDVGGGYHHAFSYLNGVMTDLGTLGGPNSGALAVNATGTIVGQSDIVGGNSVAMSYNNGVMAALPVAGSSIILQGYSAAYAINDSGIIVGCGYVNQFTTQQPYDSFIDDNGVVTIIAEPGGTTAATGINSSGMVTGVYALNYSNFYWDGWIYIDNTFQSIGTVGASWVTTPLTLNDAGTLVGYYSNPNSNHGDNAFSWANGVFTALGYLPGGNQSTANAINNNGDIVGWSTVADGTEHAMIVHSGVMSDLNAETIQQLPTTLTYAAAINDQGQIVAVGANQHTYLLTPAIVIGVKSVSASPSPTCPGLLTKVTFTLSQPAPAGGLTVSAASSNPTVFPVTSSLFVPAGKLVVTLLIEAPANVSASTPVTVTVSLNGAPASTTFNVVPWVASVSVTPSTVVAGGGAVMTINLANPAPSGGLLVDLASSNADATFAGVTAGNPLSVTIPAGATSAAVNVVTFTSGSGHSAKLSAGNHGATQQCTLTITPGSGQIALLPSAVIGGDGSYGLITLGAPAPPQGTAVTLTSSNPAASVPTSIMVPAGATTAAFSITTSTVATTTTASITATAGTITTSASLTIQPVTLATLDLFPNFLVGGNNSIGIVTLSAPATNPVTVTLSSSDSAVALPDQTVTIPVGATTGTFNINTYVVNQAMTAYITAALNGSTQEAAISVNP